MFLPRDVRTFQKARLKAVKSGRSGFLTEDPRILLRKQRVRGNHLARVRPSFLRSEYWLDDPSMCLGLLDRGTDVLHLGFDRRREVGERAVGAEDLEKVGESVHVDAVERRCGFSPFLLDREAVPADDLPVEIVAIDGIEPAKEKPSQNLVANLSTSSDPTNPVAKIST